MIKYNNNSLFLSFTAFITITSHLRQVNDRTVTHLTLYVKDKDMYICFNKKWQPRLFVSIIIF